MDNLQTVIQEAARKWDARVDQRSVATAEPDANPQDESVDTLDESLKSSLDTHLMHCSWATDDWRSYVEWLENGIDAETSTASDGPRCPGYAEQQYTLPDIQDIQRLEDKANEAIMVLESNTEVLNDLRKYYHNLLDHKAFPNTLTTSCEDDIAVCVTKLDELANDCRMQYSRANVLANIVSDRKELVLQHLQAQAVARAEQINRNLERDSVSKRIIASVTSIYLPTTFVSTFFSTDVIKERDGEEDEGRLHQLFEHAISRTFSSSRIALKSTRAASNAILESLGVLISPVFRITPRFDTSTRLISALLALNILAPGVAAQGTETATNSDWRQRALDTLSELVVAAATLVAPTIVLAVIGGIAFGQLWAEAQGRLAFFALMVAFVYAGIHPKEGSTTKESDQYIRQAVGLGYVMLMLAFCRVVMLKPKHRRAPGGRRRNREHGSIFATIATVVAMVLTAIVMAFPSCRDYWKALTALHPTFAVFLAVPVSFFLCGVVCKIGSAVHAYEEEENGHGYQESGESSAFHGPDTRMGRMQTV